VARQQLLSVMSAPAADASPEPPPSTSDIVHATNLSTCEQSAELVPAWQPWGIRISEPMSLAVVLLRHLSSTAMHVISSARHKRRHAHHVCVSDVTEH
jgi:hypothetical protein